MRILWLSLVFLLEARLVQAAGPARISLDPAPGMLRADLYHVETVRHPRAVLALCPGCNGIGEGLVKDLAWQAFAEKHGLGLVGISFASELKDIYNDKGYYYAGNGSGQLLLDGINMLFGRDLPVLIYGFSGGAHFTARFTEWKPERVIAWCAYSAGWWDNPKQADIMPPGIVACGENDERLGASLVYFKQGRALGRPWLWIGVQNNGHAPDARVEAFARDYFKTILENSRGHDSTRTGIWIDINKRNIAEAHVLNHPSVTGWLPDVELLDAWRSLNGL